MKRKLLFAERMLHGDGTEPFNTVFPIRIKGHISSGNLDNALTRLQHKHALLRAFVETDKEGMQWFVVGENTLDIPVRVILRTSEEDWQTESTKEWATVFDTAKGPLIRFVWIKGEEVSDLLMVMHHCFCDGEAALSILTELLLLLDDRDTDIGPAYPILNIKDIVPPEILNSKMHQTKAKLIGSAAAFLLKLIPIKKRPFDRGKDYLINEKLDKDLSGRLMAKCKAEGVTVNTVLCLAVLNAFSAVRKTQFHNKISCPVNIRRFAPQIKKDYMFAFGLMLVVSADKNLGFFDDARKMQENINRKTSKLDPYGILMMMENAHSAIKRFINLLKYSKSSNDCMFSNLGKLNIRQEYDTFSIETIFTPSVMGPLGNTTTLITSTFRDTMDFTFVGSEGYLPYVDALAIKNKMIEIISAQTSN